MTTSENFWWYITLGAENGREEDLSSLADLSGSIGSELHELPQGIRLRAYFRGNQDLGFWVRRVNEALSAWPEISIVDMGKIENQQWNRVWREAFPPLPVGGKLLVMAPWHKGTLDTSGRIPLLIYPKSAFGTGYHESTQLALEALEKWSSNRNVALDVGTGTGILTIAALKLGVNRAIARDIDPAALSELRENLKLNEVDESRVTIEVANLLDGFKGRISLLIANILFEPLVQMLPNVPTVLEANGVALFSGLLVRERDRFIDELDHSNLVLLEERTKGDWWCVVAQVKA